MLSLIFSFTVFSIYVVFSYGFYFGQPRHFEFTANLTKRIVTRQKFDVELLCQTDRRWEWCRWIHNDRYCDYEWINGGVRETGCDFPGEKIEYIGNYHNFECGIVIRNADVADRGLWQCEIEKYYLGFSRR